MDQHLLTLETANHESDYRVIGMDLEVDDVDWEECHPGALDSVQECDLATLIDIPEFAPRYRKQEIAEVTADDFDTPLEGRVFNLLDRTVRDTFEVSVAKQRRARAVEWVFCPTDEELTFDLCCHALSMRPHVLRTRIMYEFYLRWSVFPNWPFLALGLPEDLCGEIGYYCNAHCLEIAKRIWVEPSMSTAALVQEFRHPTLEADVKALLDRGYLTNRGGNLYLVGRNPDKGKSLGPPLVTRRRRRMGFWSDCWI